MSDYIDMTVFAATYDSVNAAKEDYQTVMDLYDELGLMDTFDAAIIEKKENGKVKIVKKHEQPTIDAGWRGAGWGLATGLVVALFPGALIGIGGLFAAEGAGGAIGALAGHAAAGMSRGDLKDLGEGLDLGESGLIVIAETDVGDRVNAALDRANKVIKKQIKKDDKELSKELKEAEKE